MKNISGMLTFVAVGAAVLALSPPARADERRAYDPTLPSYQQPHDRDASSPYVNAHVDSHVAPRPGDFERDPRKDEARADDRREHARPRWTPSPERYTRPPSQWRR